MEFQKSSLLIFLILVISVLLFSVSACVATAERSTHYAQYSSPRLLDFRLTFPHSGEKVEGTRSDEYEPKHAQYFRYTTFAEALSFQRASLVVGHGGTGTVLNSLRFKVPLILVPRRIQFRELDDDHQLEIAQGLEGKGDRKDFVKYFF